MGAAVACPHMLVIDIDGDGNFIMNGQLLVAMQAENLSVKIMVLNNQELGHSCRLEDRFYEADRVHTYLENPSKPSEILPDMVNLAKSFGIPAACVTKKEDLKAEVQKTLDTPAPYLLDVVVPHRERVLPMITSGGAFKDFITEGDKSSS